MDPERITRLRKLMQENPQAAEGLRAIVDSSTEAGLVNPLGDAPTHHPSAEAVMASVPPRDVPLHDAEIEASHAYMDRHPDDNVLPPWNPDAWAIQVDAGPPEDIRPIRPIAGVDVGASVELGPPSDAEFLGNPRMPDAARLTPPGRMVADIGDARMGPELSVGRAILESSEDDFEDDFDDSPRGAAAELGSPRLRGARAELGAPSPPRNLTELAGSAGPESPEPDAPDYSSGSKLRMLAGILQMIAGKEAGEGALRNAALADKRAEEDFRRRQAQRGIGAHIGGATGLPGDMTREDARLATQLGRIKPDGSAAEREWKAEQAELNRQHALMLQDRRNQGRVDAVQAKRGRGGGGSSRPRPPTLEPEEFQRLQQLEQMYTGGNQSVLPELRRALLKEHRGDSQEVARALSALRGASSQNFTSQRGMQSEVRKADRSFAHAQAAIKRAGEVVGQLGGPDHAIEYARELTSPSAMTGGKVSQEAGALRTAVLSVMGQIASMKGGAALTESEIQMLGGGGRVHLLRDKLQGSDWRDVWNPAKWLSSGAGGQLIASMRESLTANDIMDFLNNAPRVMQSIRRGYESGNPTAPAMHWREGDRQEAVEQVETRFVDAHPELDDASDVEVEGPVPGSSTQWYVSVDGQQQVFYME